MPGRGGGGGGMGTMAVELTQHKEWCAGLGKGDGVNMCCPSFSLSRLLLPPTPPTLMLYVCGKFCRMDHKFCLLVSSSFFYFSLSLFYHFRCRLGCCLYARFFLLNFFPYVFEITPHPHLCITPLHYLAPVGKKNVNYASGFAYP